MRAGRSAGEQAARSADLPTRRQAGSSASESTHHRLDPAPVRPVRPHSWPPSQRPGHPRGRAGIVVSYLRALAQVPPRRRQRRHRAKRRPPVRHPMRDRAGITRSAAPRGGASGLPFGESAVRLNLTPLPTVACRRAHGWADASKSGVLHADRGKPTRAHLPNIGHSARARGALVSLRTIANGCPAMTL